MQVRLVHSASLALLCSSRPIQLHSNPVPVAAAMRQRHITAAKFLMNLFHQSVVVSRATAKRACLPSRAESGAQSAGCGTPALANSAWSFSGARPAARAALREAHRAAALALGALLLCGAAWAQVSISSGGQASTGLPIAVPPGISGMAPNLSLNYADGGINGPVGVGWSVQGISTITRCPSTRPLDGTYRSVLFNKDDKLCLDGQRLIQTDAEGSPLNVLSGPKRLGQTDDALGIGSASAFREFRTEKDSYSRVRAYGVSSGSCNDPASTASPPAQLNPCPHLGPARFVVWTKSGLKYEYGLLGSNDENAVVRAEGSNVVAVWAVRRISDVYGNFMLFDYSQRLLDDSNGGWGSRTVDAGSINAREWNLMQVQYTGQFNVAPPHAVLSQPVNRVVFEYTDRNRNPPANVGHDAAEAYQYNSKNVSVQRLSAIKTYVGGAGGSGGLLVKNYQLTYTLSPTSGRSLLQSVRECADETAAKCLPPTTFTYRSNDAPTFVERASFSLKNALLLDNSNQAGVLTGDFNGDGRTDILRYRDDPAGNVVYESDGTGQFSARSSDVTAHILFHSNGCYHSMVADFNGDGLSDILRVVARNNPGCSGAAGDNLVLISAPVGGTRNFQPVAVPAAARLERKASTTTFSAPRPCTALQRTPADTSPAAVRQTRELPLDTWFDGSPQATDRPAAQSESLSAQCRTQITTVGYSYYVLDADGDGFLDIVTAATPDMVWQQFGPAPSGNQICSGSVSAMNAQSSLFGGPCTRFFRGSATGAFEERGTNVAHRVLYKAPNRPQWNSNPYWVLPDLVDVDGDGLMDIRADSGTWRSLGNGDFTTSGFAGVNPVCSLPIDFNGDGRADCLSPSNTEATQNLRLAYGATWSNPVTTFNLASTPLSVNDANGSPTIGVVVEDFDGDGRQDILRWSSSSFQNEIYLSRGDGSFRPAGGANLLNMQIQRADGARSFVLGDFVGDGTVQILRLAANPPSSFAGGISIACYSLHCNDPPPPPAGISDTVYNMMLVRQGQVGPIDVLASVTSPTGLTSTVDSRVVLTRGLNPADGTGYEPDRGTAQAATAAPELNMVDLQPPMYVVTATSRQTGSGTLTTRYRYTGLKADRGGRGMLGFRRMQQLDATPATAPGQNAQMTVVTDYVLQHPYIGVAARTRTFLGGFGSESQLEARQNGGPASGQHLLSLTENTYCEALPLPGELAAATFNRPCRSDELRIRPHLLRTVERGWDLTGTALPTVTTSNTYNLFGDVETIRVDTTGSVGGQEFQSTKITTNTFCPPNAATCAPGVAGPSPNRTSGDNWILGRLSKSTVVSSSSPNTLLGAVAGSAPNATATTGTPPPGTPVAINPAVLQIIINMLLED